MNTDKAYLLGLIIGGGIFGSAEDVFRIRLPYKKWGSYTDNPQRAGQIARDILQKVGQMFRAVYNLSVQYETTPSGTWTILCEGDISGVKEDLTYYVKAKFVEMQILVQLCPNWLMIILNEDLLLV